MDSKNSAEVRVTADVKSELGSNATTASVLVEEVDEENCPRKEEKACSVSASASTSYLCSRSSLIQGDESESKREESINPSSREIDKTRKSSAHLKSSSGNRKVKVDWTPELHRKFVQAVEQLGVDKAVPSKILELMGIDCLTRHNVASHLQKYRSHRKHILAREAKSTSWNWRQQKCGTSGKRDKDAWVVPTTGFPPVTPSPHFRPLHVWGYPSVDQSLLYKCPQPPPPPPLSTDPQFWYYHHQDVPPQGMPCFIPHVSPTMYPAPPVPGIPPTSMYSTYPSVRVPTIIKEQTMPMHPCDFHPSKESIDTVIGDVLSKPWLPLPLGLKPPSTESVLVELQNLGISKIPPAASGSSSEFAGQEKNHSI